MKIGINSLSLPKVLRYTNEINNTLNLSNKDIFIFVLNNFDRVSNAYLTF